MKNKTDSNQRMLNWLENEKKRDNLEEKSYKNKILKEIKSLNKTFLEEMKNCNEKCCKCNRNANYLNKTNNSLLCWTHSVNL